MPMALVPLIFGKRANPPIVPGSGSICQSDKVLSMGPYALPKRAKERIETDSG